MAGGTLVSSYSRRIGRHTFAGAPSACPLSAVIATGLANVASYDTSVISGTGAHWQGVGTGVSNFPTAASNSSLADADYTIRVTVNWTDLTSSTIDVPVTIVTSYTPSADVVAAQNDTRMTAYLAAQADLTVAEVYSISTAAEFSAARARISSASGVLILTSKNIDNRPSCTINGMTAWTAKWLIVANEDDDDRSPYARIWLQSGGFGPFVMDRVFSNRSLDKDGLAWSDMAFHLRSAAGPILAAGLVFDGECDGSNSVDAITFRDVASWTYCSGEFTNYASLNFGSLTKSVFGTMYCDQFANNVFFFQAGSGVCADRDFEDVYIGEASIANNTRNGWHTDGIQLDNTITDYTGSTTKIRKLMILSGRGYSMQGAFNLFGLSDVEQFFYCGPSYWGLQLWDTEGGTIKRATVVGAPDTALLDPDDWVGTSPSIDTDGGTPTGTVTVEDSFAQNVLATPAGSPSALRCTVLGTNRNADVSSYFQSPITTAPDSGLTFRQLIELYQQSYAPVLDGPLKNADGTYQGAFFPDGSWNDGSIYSSGGGSMATLEYLSGSSVSIPANFDASQPCTVHVIGAGGKGSSTGSSGQNHGGGGGAYATKTFAGGTYTASQSIDVNIPAGNAEQIAWWDDIATLAADYGRNATTSAGGAGGLAANSVGDTVYDGGSGGTVGVTWAAGGGGGSAGPDGAGKNGGGGGTTGSNGAGGGGSNGGSSTVGGNNHGGDPASSGGHGNGGTGGGAGGTSTDPGQPGTDGGGGGGGRSVAGAPSTGGAGGQQDIWTGTVSGLIYGPGGGGGGTSNQGSVSGGGGAPYGGGGGGARGSSTLAGDGGQALIILEYTTTGGGGVSIPVFQNHYLQQGIR